MRTKVEDAAIAWRDAHQKACAAPLGDPSVWTDLGAAETALSEAVAAHLEEEAEEARLAARPKLFVIHGWQHGGRFTEEACTLEEAIHSARVAAEWGYWHPEEICTVSGELVLGGEGLSAKVYGEAA